MQAGQELYHDTELHNLYFPQKTRGIPCRQAAVSRKAAIGTAAQTKLCLPAGLVQSWSLEGLKKSDWSCETRVVFRCDLKRLGESLAGGKK